MERGFKEKQAIFFDLDGTLTDPKEGITRSVAYALSKLGTEVLDLNELVPFIGPPLKDTFMEYLNFTESDALLAVGLYRERYQEAGMFENVLYEGIPGLLEQLKTAGKSILLATSKPEVFAKQILEHFGISRYFDFIGGSTLDHTRDSKEAVLRYAMETSGLTDVRTSVMVGDSKYDVLGAKACGLEAIGVLYGYGSREELETSGAAEIAGNVEALRRMLL